MPRHSFCLYNNAVTQSHKKCHITSSTRKLGLKRGKIEAADHSWLLGALGSVWLCYGLLFGGDWARVWSCKEIWTSFLGFSSPFSFSTHVHVCVNVYSHGFVEHEWLNTFILGLFWTLVWINSWFSLSFCDLCYICVYFTLVLMFLNAWSPFSWFVHLTYDLRELG